MKSRILAVCGLVAILFMVTGCSSAALGPFSDEPVNLTALSYSAADMLVQQANRSISPQTPLQVGPLTDIKDPGEVTAFGTIVARQVAARFVQMGYRTSAPGLDEVMVAREQAVTQQWQGGNYQPPAGQAVGNVMVLGQYVKAKKELLVNMRMVEPGTGQILAAYDFSVPLNSDIRELTRTGDDDKSTGPF